MTKKKPEDYPLFTMRMDPKDKERYSKLAKKHGYTLAKLIREGLRVVEENENFLDPTVNPYLARIQQAQLGEHKELTDSFQSVTQTQEGFNTRLTNVERLLEKLALHEGLSKKDIKKAQKKDISGEVVFE